MRDFRDAKLMAQTLRKALAAKNFTISHSESLELIAKEFGVADWNTLSAKLAESSKPEPSPLRRVNFNVPAKPLKHGIKLPLIPLRDIVVFPQMVTPLFMGRARSIHAAESVVSGDRRLLLVTQRNPLDENPGLNDLHRMGVVAVLLQHMKAPDGNVHAWIRGEQRAALIDLKDKVEIHEAEIAPVAKHRPGSETQALSHAVFNEHLAYAKAIASASHTLSNLSPHRWQPLSGTEDPDRLADAMAASLAISVAERQELLESDVSERLQKIRSIIKRELAAA